MPTARPRGRPARRSSGSRRTSSTVTARTARKTPKVTSGRSANMSVTSHRRTCIPSRFLLPRRRPMSDATFADRRDAGRQLAALLETAAIEDPVVLALPRGGVPIGREVAQALRAPLDVLVVRKVGVPYRPELAMGAVGEADVVVIDQRIVRECGVRPDEVEEVVARERGTVETRLADYRGGRPATSVAHRTAVIVDDGLATGATARAACQVARG